ncbi:MAG TPA: DUF58 domain-containing protein [Actinomycetota bacterium]
MPTVRGRILAAASLVLYVVARALSVDELFALSAAALVFPALAMGAIRLRSAVPSIERSIGPRRLFAGRVARVTYTVRNEARRSTTPILIEDPAPAIMGGAIVLAMPGLRRGAGGTVSIDRRLTGRGRHPVGPLRVRIVDPLGLAERTVEAAAAQTVTVYPKVELLRERSPGALGTGEAPARAHRIANTGDEFYAIREWRDGDDLRKVHWRSTARSGGLMVRQEEQLPHPRATLFYDNRLPSLPRAESGFEWGITLIASIAWELSRQGTVVRAATLDIPPGVARWGREAAEPILSMLAVTAPSPSSLLPAARALTAARGAGGTLIAALPPPSEADARALAAARGAYGWAGAVLIDVGSFAGVVGRSRSEYDHRLAQAQRILGAAGWRVVVAGRKDTPSNVWNALVGPSRPLASLRSSRS